MCNSVTHTTLIYEKEESFGLREIEETNGPDRQKKISR